MRGSKHREQQGDTVHAATRLPYVMEPCTLSLLLLSVNSSPTVASLLLTRLFSREQRLSRGAQRKIKADYLPRSFSSLGEKLRREMQLLLDAQAILSTEHRGLATHCAVDVTGEVEIILMKNFYCSGGIFNVAWQSYRNSYTSRAN